jgi:hypothetical protein
MADGCFDARDSPVHVPKPDALESLYGRKRDADATHDGVYVRKWMRTRHSIIFRLSNNNFQVCARKRTCVSLHFFDSRVKIFKCIDEWHGAWSCDAYDTADDV